MAEKEQKRQRFTMCSVSLHVLHICLSIGLIIAVIHNQLVNNIRFEKLEQKCDCMDHKSNEMSLHRRSNTHRQRKTFLEELSSKKHDRVSKREVFSLLETVLGTNDSALAEPAVTKESKNQDPMVTSTREVKTQEEETTGSTTLKEVLQNTTKETLSTKVYQETPGLISCWNDIKDVIDHFVKTLKSRPKEKGGCEALKGERGEKGCAGTSFAPPLFHPSPKKFVFNEGESHVLSCNATGNPAVEINWYFDNRIIQADRDKASRHYNIEKRIIAQYGTARAETICPNELPHPVVESSLKIRRLNGLDTGTYTCKAHNFMGTSSHDIQIIVQEYVRYTTIPSNTIVTQGQNVKLRCRASSVPAPTITWYRKDGGPMPRNYSVIDGDLLIQNITKKEEGTFTCLAGNVLGSKTTDAIVVVEIHPKFTIPIEMRQVINQSENLILQYNATGYPAPAVHCSKTNGSLPLGRHFYNSQMLNISNIVYEDRGEYVCTANNSAGRIVTKVQVIVQVAPNITLQPSKVEYGFRGKTKKLTINAFAIPAPQITWRKPIYGADRRRMREENGSLVIDNVQYTDSGLYQATASNILGQVKVETFLVVKDGVPASIRSKPFQPEVSLTEGMNFTKMCSAVGIPTPHIIWKHNDNNTTNTTLVSNTTFALELMIHNVTSRHAGQYTCLVSNQFGFAKQHFMLKVISKWVRVTFNGYRSDNYYTRRRQRRISSSTGELMSQNSKFYDSNFNGRWKLTSNTRIKVKFIRFSTEKNYDKLKIYDGDSSSSPSLGEYSGDTLPPSITSSSNSLYITFTTDGSKQKTGFLAVYSGVV